MANGDTVVVVHTIRNEAGVKEVRAVCIEYVEQYA